MADKYQVLEDPNKKHTVIEQIENINGKSYWKIYIPDAGDRNSAAKVARLLNEEYARDQAKRAVRNPSNV